ncbi:hypothetical protein WJX81_001025 [Elliptochloris bilobata]|uniref:NAD(P)H dehydrogenase (quinone) n=1 Tax=Elliptochloris bilobata TaxID=381761 RepID=A0AAW1QJ49_9CHLO
MAVKVYIIYYSMYGHVAKLAQKEKEGVDSVEGAEGVLFQCAETLPEEVLGKMHAPPKEDVPVIDVHNLPEADGFLFGFPTRYGSPAAQFKAMEDATGGLWQSGALRNKPAGLFTSTATQGGGQEVTCLTAVPFLVHHGMIYVSAGYGLGPELFSNEHVRGGSPWGAGTFANGDGSRQPTDLELAFAKYQGAEFAKICLKLAS